MAISDQVIEQIRMASDIVSVIGDYVPDLKKAGRNWKACCPFHTENTPSFVVNPEKGIFKCFGCGVAGDVFKFVTLIENISWIEAVKKLAQKSGIVIEEDYSQKISVSEKTKIFELLELVSKFYNKCFLESQFAKFARNYAVQRGITSQTIQKFMIGYAPKGKLLEFTKKKGYDYKVLLKSGLFTKTDSGIFEYMSDRFVFPIYDIQGRVVAFGGRTLGNSKAKYLNTPETIVYSKSSNLYGLFQALPEIKKNKSIILVEGYMDVVLSQQHGVYGAVAPLGTAFTWQQAKLIDRYSQNTVLLFDPDEAGRTATQRALEICAENDITVYTSSLPDNVDPDEYLLANGKENFYKLLDKNLKSAIKFMIDRVSSKYGTKTLEAKTKIVSDLLDFVSKNKNAIIQRDYIKQISQTLNLEEEVVWQEFKRKVLFKAENVSQNIQKQKQTEKINLEEQLLGILLEKENRYLIKKITKDFFTMPNCITVYGMLINNSEISVSEIMSKLDDKTAKWFSDITISNKEEPKVSEEKFNILCKDIEIKRLIAKRKSLEKEVLLMTEGKKEMDLNKIKEYQELTKEIKGSGKK